MPNAPADCFNHGLRLNLICYQQKSFCHYISRTYSSLEAIVSMLQTPNGGLRLSDTSTMNDPDEGRSTIEDRNVLHLLKNEFGEESWLGQRYIAANVCSFVGIVRDNKQRIDPGDDLLFWRLYGNDCRGVSVTMPPHVSKNLVDLSIVDRVAYTDEPLFQNDLSSLPTLLQDLDNLRSRASEAGEWSKISPDVLSVCDQIFKRRFLRKRSHYEMEREYRSVAFLSGDDNEDSRYSRHGRHVRYGFIRRFVEIPELSCESILTTNSQITIGSNVPEAPTAKNVLSDLLKSKGREIVSIRVSEILYQPR